MNRLVRLQYDLNPHFFFAGLSGTLFRLCSSSIFLNSLNSSRIPFNRDLTYAFITVTAPCLFNRSEPLHLQKCAVSLFYIPLLLDLPKKCDLGIFYSANLRALTVDTLVTASLRCLSKSPSIESLLFLEMHLQTKVCPLGLLLLLIAFSTSGTCVQALLAEELQSLETLFYGFPQLGALPEHPSTRNAFHYGARWTAPSATVCESDGWTFYGIYCEAGSIVGVRMYVPSILYTLCLLNALRLTIPLLPLEIAFGANGTTRWKLWSLSHSSRICTYSLPYERLHAPTWHFSELTWSLKLCLKSARPKFCPETAVFSPGHAAPPSHTSLCDLD